MGEKTSESKIVSNTATVWKTSSTQGYGTTKLLAPDLKRQMRHGRDPFRLQNAFPIIPTHDIKKLFAPHNVTIKLLLRFIVMT